MTRPTCRSCFSTLLFTSGVAAPKLPVDEHEASALKQSGGLMILNPGKRCRFWILRLRPESRFKNSSGTRCSVFA